MCEHKSGTVGYLRWALQDMPDDDVLEACVETEPGKYTDLTLYHAYSSAGGRMVGLVFVEKEKKKKVGSGWFGME